MKSELKDYLDNELPKISKEDLSILTALELLKPYMRKVSETEYRPLPIYQIYLVRRCDPVPITRILLDAHMTELVLKHRTPVFYSNTESFNDKISVELNVVKSLFEIENGIE